MDASELVPLAARAVDQAIRTSVDRHQLDLDEGEWRPGCSPCTLAVARAVSRFYRADEYQPLREMRHRAAECKLAIFPAAE